MSPKDPCSGNQAEVLMRYGGLFRRWSSRAKSDVIGVRPLSSLHQVYIFSTAWSYCDVLCATDLR